MKRTSIICCIVVLFAFLMASCKKEKFRLPNSESLKEKKRMLLSFQFPGKRVVWEPTFYAHHENGAWQMTDTTPAIQLEFLPAGRLLTYHQPLPNIPYVTWDVSPPRWAITEDIVNGEPRDSLIWGTNKTRINFYFSPPDPDPVFTLMTYRYGQVYYFTFKKQKR